MTVMAARVTQDAGLARHVDRLEERTALLRERLDDLRGEMIRGHESLRHEMIRGDEALRSEMNRGFNAVDLRLSDLQTTLGTLREDTNQRHDSMLRGQESLREDMNQRYDSLLRGQESLREDMNQRYDSLLRGQESLREDMMRGDAALAARIDKLDSKMTFFFGTLLVTILAQMALQFLRQG